jgi:hypothetical protein
MRLLGIVAIFPVLPFTFAQTPVPENLAPIRVDRILQHIRTLASDDFEGRGPGSDGETKTIQYLVQQFRSFGLQPGNPDGTYLQRVPISILRSQGEASFRAKSGVVQSVPREAILVYSYRASPVVNLEHTEVMFAGYGVSVPAAGWDDYGAADVRGKTVLILGNDPRAEQINPAAAMPPIPTLYRHYHTNRLVKVEEAARRGAAAVILVRASSEGDPVWQGVVNAQRELALATGSDRLHPPVEAMIRSAALDHILTGTDYNYAKLAAAAAQHGFRVLPLPITADFAVRNVERRFESHNVVARLAGSDRALQEQHVIYTSHWDALGRDPSRSGDQMFHGALDDAGGTAQLLEIARSFASAPVAPRRSILFLATTAEEKGLIGSRYYVDHPLYPLSNTVAEINLDGVQAFGSPADMVSVGGQSSLDAELERIARLNGRVFAVLDSALYYQLRPSPLCGCRSAGHLPRFRSTSRRR